MADLRKILEKFNTITEGITPVGVKSGLNTQQRSVDQMPADAKVPNQSPVLGGTVKKNPLSKWLVGSNESIEEQDASPNGLSPDTKEILEGMGDSPVARAIANRIIRLHPEMVTDYGIEYLMQAIDDEAERVGDVDEIGSSDVSAWIQNIKRNLDSELTREGMLEDSKTPAQKRDFKNVMAGAMSRDEYNKKYSLGKYAAKDPKKKLDPTGVYRNLIKTVSEDVATEDVLSTVKKKLGDYLKNIEDEIKSDPDLKDKLDKDIDVVGPAVKTLTTDDGHEIKIHGNEDDGFRVTIQNKPAKSTFKDLDEASMAVEMFNARRRRAAMPSPEVEIVAEPVAVKPAPRAALLQRLKQNNDYVDEK